MHTQQAIPRLDFEKKAFYTPAEVASLLQVHVSTVRDWIHSGRLVAIQLSERIYRIPLGALMELLGEPAAETRRELPEAEAEALWHELSSEHRTAASRGPG